MRRGGLALGGANGRQATMPGHGRTTSGDGWLSDKRDKSGLGQRKQRGTRGSLRLKASMVFGLWFVACIVEMGVIPAAIKCD